MGFFMNERSNRSIHKHWFKSAIYTYNIQQQHHDRNQPFYRWINQSWDSWLAWRLWSPPQSWFRMRNQIEARTVIDTCSCVFINLLSNNMHEKVWLTTTSRILVFSKRIYLSLQYLAKMLEMCKINIIETVFLVCSSVSKYFCNL